MTLVAERELWLLLALMIWTQFRPLSHTRYIYYVTRHNSFHPDVTSSGNLASSTFILKWLFCAVM